MDTEIFTATIEALSGDGTGYCHYAQSKCFIAGTVPGDVVKARLTFRNNKYSLAELVCLIAPSPQRCQSDCPWFPQCGGCISRNLQTEIYYQTKLEQLLRNLSYAGITVAPEQLHLHRLGDGQRRRIRLQCVEGKLGLFQSHTQTLVPIDHCLNLTAPLNQLLPKLHQLQWDHIKAVEITAVQNGIMLNLLALQPPAPELIAALQQLPEIIIIGYTYLTSQTSIVCWQRQVPLVTLKDLAVAIPLNAFLQASQQAQDLIIDFLLAKLQHQTRVADLYGGIGTYGLALSYYQSLAVVTYEGNMEMVHTAQRCAQQQHLNYTAQQRDLAKHPLTPKELRQFTAVIIDPPRNGAPAQMLNLAKAKPELLIYISCNSESLAQDLRNLIPQYQLTELVCIDQFYRAKHLETIAVLQPSQATHCHTDTEQV